MGRIDRARPGDRGVLCVWSEARARLIEW